jgi:TetR/AcrR family transcriptional regulator, lmrAB and yxaGH operons repressor
MPRPVSIEDEALIERLSHCFRAVGYVGASLADLSEATGLSKPALYHRFPGGKQQMAAEVLSAAGKWYEEHIFAPLRAEGEPAARLSLVARQLDRFYASGRQACLLNMLSAPRSEDSPFATAIKEMFETLLSVFAKFAEESGVSRGDARARAARGVAMLHGSLVLSRGLGSNAPFKSFLASLADDLLGPEAKPKSSTRPPRSKQPKRSS